MKNKKEYEHAPIERFELDRLREHSKEKQANRKTFVITGGYNIGFEINWAEETVRWFLYKDKKRLAYKITEPYSLRLGTVPLKHTLLALIFEQYQEAGRDRIPMYAEFELAVPVSHLSYLVWSNTLSRALARQEV